MIKTLIVDDDPFTLECLKDALELYCQDVLPINEARSIKEAVTYIKKDQPDLVFLDIELPNEDGFSLFEYFDTIPFDVIFVTSHEKFAVKAFKYSAMDYLLKPVDPQELRKAVNKVAEGINQRQKLMQINLLLQQMNSKNESRIAIPGVRGVEFIDHDSIIYLKSNINYTIFYKNNGKSAIATKTLKEYEDVLPPQQFFRIHKSYIVNISAIKGFSRSTGMVLLENEVQLPVARRRKDQFMSLLINA